MIKEAIDFVNVRRRLERRRKIHESYQALFLSPVGKEVLNHLCQVGHVTSSTFVKGDPHQTSLNEGKRLIVLSILKFVNKDPRQLAEEIEKGMQEYEN